MPRPSRELLSGAAGGGHARARRSWFDWVRRTLESRSLTVIEATPEGHDRAMAIVPGPQSFLRGGARAHLEASRGALDETIPFTSPIYLAELLLSGRHFAQSADLYAAIQTSNPETERITSEIFRSASDLREWVRTGDRESFRTMFADVRAFFGEFEEEALERSSQIIDRIVERQ